MTQGLEKDVQARYESMLVGGAYLNNDLHMTVEAAYVFGFILGARCAVLGEEVTLEIVRKAEAVVPEQGESMEHIVRDLADMISGP